MSEHKTTVITNPKNKDMEPITISTDTGDADIAAFGKLGYDVAAIQKERAAAKAAK